MSRDTTITITIRFDQPRAQVALRALDFVEGLRSIEDVEVTSEVNGPNVTGMTISEWVADD